MSAEDRAPVIAPLLAALVTASGIAWGLVAPPRSEAVARPDASTSLAAPVAEVLASLEVGTRLAGWRVVAVVPADEPGGARVDLERDDLRFGLSVIPREAAVHSAPTRTEHWAIYYGHVRPQGARVPTRIVTAVTAALEREIRARE